MADKHRNLIKQAYLVYYQDSRDDEMCGRWQSCIKHPVLVGVVIGNKDIAEAMIGTLSSENFTKNYNKFMTREQYDSAVKMYVKEIDVLQLNRALENDEKETSLQPLVTVEDIEKYVRKTSGLIPERESGCIVSLFNLDLEKDNTQEALKEWYMEYGEKDINDGLVRLIREKSPNATDKQILNSQCTNYSELLRILKREEAEDT